MTTLCEASCHRECKRAILNSELVALVPRLVASRSKQRIRPAARGRSLDDDVPSPSAPISTHIPADIELAYHAATQEFPIMSRVKVAELDHTELKVRSTVIQHLAATGRCPTSEEVSSSRQTIEVSA